MQYQMMRLLVWLTGHVPRRARLAVAGALGEVVFWAWRSKRRITTANMAQVLGVPPDAAAARWAARRSWRNYGRYMVEFFYLPNASVADIIARIEDTTPAPGWRARLEAANATGRGILFPTAHYGNWDAGGVVMASVAPVHVIAETFADPRLNELVVDQRARLGMTVIPAEGSLRRIMRALQEGGHVATPVDRPVAEGDGVPITFFGRRCFAPGGTAKLALKTGAYVIPGFVWNDEQYSTTYYGYTAEPILFQSTADRDADIIALTQLIYDEIESAIRKHPTQWYMFRPFWPQEGADAIAPTPDMVAASPGARDGTANGEG
ncbi:MAG TPA: lysophospholipid acyltransferase family protein [Ktedonobacterales bacterium]|nr:lysophospholipid acyltransferase family protein [Ktedonobacterales bacterium]